MKVLLIDGDNNLHRAFHKFKYMKDKDGNSTSMMYGFPYIISSLLKMFSPDECIIAFDYGRNKRRTEILPTYKQRDDRHDMDRESFEKQRITTEALVKALGLGYVRKQGHEADDIIYWLCRKYKHADKIIIVSNDKDFDQLLTKKISVWCPNHDNMYTHKGTRNELTPKQSIDYLILDGDSSDKIPGVKGVGEKTAIEFLQTYGSIREYLKNPKPFKAITEAKLIPVYKRNKELINIKYFFRKNLRNVEYEIEKQGINERVIAKIAKRHNIKSFNNPNFLQPFKNLQHE